MNFQSERKFVKWKHSPANKYKTALLWRDFGVINSSRQNPVKKINLSRNKLTKISQNRVLTCCKRWSFAEADGERKNCHFSLNSLKLVLGRRLCQNVCPLELFSSLVFKCWICGLKNQVRSVHFEVRVATVGLKVVEISATQYTPQPSYYSSAASADVASLSASRHTRAKTAST